MKRDLGALAAREHDLVIVGGGIHGAAAAWDAAQRGLDVALLEAHDFGSGTSWNSLKTIHGGLRYLQTADLRRVRESVRERRALLRIAPELVRPLRFVVPTYGHGRDGPEAFAVGLALNELLSLDRNRGLRPESRIPPGRVLSPREVLELVPGLEGRDLTGGAFWTDAQVTSSERLVLAFLHAASSAGAVVANHVEVTGIDRRGERVAGVRARDAETGGELEVRARLVVNATGPGMDRVLALAGVRRAPVPLLHAVNLVFARPAACTHAVGVRSRGRYLFLVPWRECSMIGTAYEPARGDPRSIRDGGTGEGGAASDPFAGAFLEEAERAFPWAALSARDVALVHRGLVPGRGGAHGLENRDLVLDHEGLGGPAGLISVQGVKYTTARAVAQRVVDLAVRRVGRKAPPCRTAVTPLPMARPLEGSLEERARRAAREEMALHLADAVRGRLDLGTAGRAPAGQTDVVARVLAAELGWDAARMSAETAALAATYGPLARADVDRMSGDSREAG